jgi:ABC-2 type transport system ATP-binding protein
MNARGAIGIVPQELNMDPFFSPGEALEIQAGYYGVPKVRAEAPKRF